MSEYKSSRQLRSGGGSYGNRMYTVPENMVLIKENIFTGVRACFGPGMRVILPTEKYVGMLETSDQLLNVSASEYALVDNSSALVTPEVKYRISDPLKYINNKEPINIYKNKIQQIIRQLAGALDYNSLKNMQSYDLLSDPSV